MFSKLFKRKSATFYTYEDVPLKLYFEVANTGNLSLLVIKGKARHDDCMAAMEAIMIENERKTGNAIISRYMAMSKIYLSLIAEYTFMRASIIICVLRGWLYIDWQHLSTVNKKYSISMASPGAYTQSLRSALSSCNNLLTKAEMQRKEIERMRSSGEGKQKSFYEIIASLNSALGFTVPETITLSQYNEYGRVLKEREKKQETRKPWRK